MLRSLAKPRDARKPASSSSSRAGKRTPSAAILPGRVLTPGVFHFLGGRKPGGTTGGHHTPTFQADDGAVPVGMKVMTTLVMDFLSGRGGK
jgi:metal-dependent amidase/aminoacylase/carboxypeptidase family protein